MSIFSKEGLLVTILLIQFASGLKDLKVFRLIAYEKEDA